jgi:T-complex protein 1 subunit zeta
MNAMVGLKELMNSNPGPNKTIKMLAVETCQIKLTKDGNVVLRET